MTEAEWMACPAPGPLLEYIRDRASERQLRLWACACVRRIWDLIPRELGRRAVLVTERFIEGRATEKELRYVADAFSPCGLYDYSAFGHPAMLAAHSPLFVETVGGASRNAVLARKRTERVAEESAQAELLRHIVGNPFRPRPERRPWPASVLALAEAVYAGQDCGFALHDALLEAGAPELAEHLRQSTEHPRGCWAVDFILGK